MINQHSSIKLTQLKLKLNYDDLFYYIIYHVKFIIKFMVITTLLWCALKL